MRTRRRAQPSLLASSLLAVALALLASCAGGEAEEEEFSFALVATELRPDTTSSIGQYPEVRDALLASFEEARTTTLCSGTVPYIMRVSGVRQGESGWGTSELFLTLDADDTPANNCGGEGAFLLHPESLMEDGSAWAVAPARIEGRTLVSRMDYDTLLANRVRSLENWVTFEGELTGVPPRIDAGRLVASWSIGFLVHSPIVLTGNTFTFLDYMTFVGIAPDDDRDGDGLEGFDDSDGDGHVDRCIDGDGTVLTGVGCAADSRFADAFQLRVVFSAVPARIEGTAADVPPLQELLAAPGG